MKSDLPKQFISIGGKPILMHTLEVFWKADPLIELIVVLPQSQIETWKELCITHQCAPNHTIVVGGDSRFQSVKNGLNYIDGNGLVAIHDGVRPFVTKEIINRSFYHAGQYGSAVACVAVKDSLRKLSEPHDLQRNEAVDRSQFVAIQTPQTFEITMIKEAFTQEENAKFTDDATVWEMWGKDVSLIEGSYHNVKITTKEDLLLAENILKIRGVQ